MKDAWLDYLISAILFLIITTVVMIIEISNNSDNHNPFFFIAILIVAATSILFFLGSLRRFVIYRLISKIQYSSEDTITIQCKNVLFLTQPISRFSSVVICTILHNENGDKYYFIYPKGCEVTDFSKKYVKTQFFKNEVELTCYRDTNIVRTIRTKAGDKVVHSE